MNLLGPITSFQVLSEALDLEAAVGSGLVAAQ